MGSQGIKKRKKSGHTNDVHRYESAVDEQRLERKAVLDTFGIHSDGAWVKIIGALFAILAVIAIVTFVLID